MESRKQQEREFHNTLRKLKEGEADYKYYTSNRKFYAITRTSNAFVQEWLKRHCRNKKVLEYGCGSGSFSFFLARQGAFVTGIDISEVGISQAKKEAKKLGLTQRTRFLVMDAEALRFANNSFDIVIASGVLHHLDRKKAFPEIARVLKHQGFAIALEPIIHNPLIQLYRKMTPQLRTEFECHNILHVGKDVKLAQHFFEKVQTKFFHFATIAAVPFLRSRLFPYILSSLEEIDTILLSIPFIQRLAWMMVLILSQPKK